MASTWRCQRVSAGQRCGFENDRKHSYCRGCGKKSRPKRTPPAHRRALDLTYEQYVERNGGEFCGICGTLPKPGTKLHRDHEHPWGDKVKGGRARGLLCFQCNSAVRPYMTATWLRAAADYLDRYDEDEALREVA